MFSDPPLHMKGTSKIQKCFGCKAKCVYQYPGEGLHYKMEWGRDGVKRPGALSHKGKKGRKKVNIK
jgi:hypothetical protein